MNNTIQFELDPEITKLLSSIDNKLLILIGENTEKTYTVKEAALKLGMSTAKVREYIKAGDLPAINIGSKTGKNASYRMTSKDIETFRKKREV
jgi:Predicted transcriptional regulator